MATTEETIIISETESSNCECYNECEVIDFSEIVGNKTIEDGGFFGDLLKVARINIEDSKAKGELTKTAAGEVYANAINTAMQQAVLYALSHGKAQKEIGYIQSQMEYQLLRLKLDEREMKLKEELNAAQIKEMECKCDNDTKMTDSRISLNAANEAKMACECCNQSKLMGAQAALYVRQAEGFNDHANQKLYETQLNAWSMVFRDAEIDLNPTVSDPEICSSYSRLRARLEGTWDENGLYHPAAEKGCVPFSSTTTTDTSSTDVSLCFSDCIANGGSIADCLAKCGGAV